MNDPILPLAPKTRKAACSQCSGVRNCGICGQYTETYDYGNVQEWTTWYILVCRGCEHAFVQTVSTFSEDYEYYEEDDGSTGTRLAETITYWPALSKRKWPDWMSRHGMDADNIRVLDAVMLELYGALDNDLRMLAAIGIRTAYDIASELLGIDPSLSFDKKLDSLVTLGHIGILDKVRLEMIVEAGHASAHRGWTPKPDELNTMMDVLEHFVEESFVAPARKKRLDADAAKLKKTVPPRAERKRKPS
jgi:hypothetical protein